VIPSITVLASISVEKVDGEQTAEYTGDTILHSDRTMKKMK
jgi:hypothetical protein